MSSSDEEIPKSERFCAKHESQECEPIELSFHATRDAASHSRRPSIISLPVSEGSPSDLPDPVSHPHLSSYRCNQEMTHSPPPKKKKLSTKKQFRL
ncbi:hypothetical protein NPIL_593411 [Nephila pilipes]|uniref:Uncharacterized protein n=2 Tax=Nephila pilipes TaxID=299642 RepID=A0A8X6QL15_NEPPI|nr:hypothetical protein NPIL_593411 [Nephila pilipes]